MSARIAELETRQRAHKVLCALVVLFVSVAFAFTSNVAHAQETPPDPLREKTPDGMIYVPAGEFVMGTDEGEKPGPNTPRGLSDSQPRHSVTLPAFYIDKTEVTNAQYKHFIDETQSAPPPHWKNRNFAKGEEEFPVTHVNWFEARAFALWAGKRLPTEAEWEKTARGTQDTRYPWGNDWDKNRLVWDSNRPQRVGSKPEGASQFGALDMAGNVFEWTENWYRAYPNGPHKYPEFGEQYKVIRGGGFDGFEGIARTYYRSVARRQTRSEWIGFRCAQDAK